MTAQNLPSFELEALHTLLQQEFEFLKKQDFKSFEELQHKKQDLLNLLVDEIGGKDPEITPEAIQELIKENQDLSNRLIECQNLQKRNESLINQKLNTIQEALSSLGFQDMMKNKDTHEHLNKKSK